MSDSTVRHWYLHADLDAFFASVEQLDNPQYRGKPVIVGGKPEDRRSVVSTASYEARKFGVHSAMPVSQAYRLCPQGIFVHGRMQRYAELSYQIMNIFKDFSPDVIQISIDEAFIDLTGTERLFGPPEITAQKIKERVKNETGLTISIGLATTQYLAKIASGYSKPDGFYFVHPGDEEKFMLNLPLEKVWGVGRKSLENLKNRGFKTTRDIYEKDIELLQFMFGNNMGTFLYNAVRGNKEKNFHRESKNHSVSAETTFSWDICDIYVAETALMNLCYGVYFRLLKENGYSRTATLKIRYEDFSTVNVQETFDRNILSFDSYFEKIKNLFEKKYESGRGIRLLGVGFDNIEKEDRPYQQELFETEDSKKNLRNNEIEKTILNLTKKHPDVKIQKARMLKLKTIISVLFFSIFLLNGNSKISSQEKDSSLSTTNATGAGSILSDTIQLPDSELPDTSETEKKSILDLQLSDENHVQFFINGYWLTQMENNLNFKGKPGDFSIYWGTPIFKQEVDLSFQAILNQKFFFQTDFADEFTKNTFSFGYENGDFLKKLKISNRQITMPLNYSAQSFNYGLSGGNNQAPGISAHFEKEKLSLDFLLRYDMTQSKNATFYGLNSVTDSYIEPANFAYGSSFIFPESQKDQVSKIKNIYVESKNGTYTDENGKKYKKLSVSQYLTSTTESKILLSSSAASGLSASYNSLSSESSNSKIPSVLVTFESEDIVNKIVTSLGNYDDSTSFLGQIQEVFSQNHEIELSKYSYNLKNKIENSTALVIQNDSGFSPFLNCSIYDLGFTKDADCSVIYKSSEKQNQNYKIIFSEDEASSTLTSFFNENHNFAQIFSNSEDSSLQNPENRYPFASEIPEIYLNQNTKTDLSILSHAYNSVSSLNIGTNAVSGSIQVYKNGILQPDAQYDENTGNVKLNSNINNTDKIYIVWQEGSSDFSSGAIAMAAGLKYNFTDNFQSDLAITSSLPLSPYKHYSTVDNIQPFFAALSGGLDFSKNSFSVSEKAAFAVENPNGKGNLLLVNQTSSTPVTYYLTNTDGFQTKTTPALNSKGTENFPILEEKNNFSPLNISPQKDNSISGYKIPLTFDFSSCDDDEISWAAVDIRLTNGYFLKNSNQIEISLKNDCDLTGYEIYVQLGIYAGENFYGEDSDLIPTWKINGDNANLTDTNGTFSEEEYSFSSTEWQTVSLSFSSEDYGKLTSNYDARLIIVRPASSNPVNDSGTLFFGPYEPEIQNIFTIQDEKIEVKTKSVLSVSPSAKKLAINDNYSSQIFWNTEDSDCDTEITTATYFTSADIPSYSELNFDFAFTGLKSQTTESDSSLTALTFILDSDSSSIYESSKEAVVLKIFDINNYICEDSASVLSPEYHFVCVNLAKRTVKIDDTELPDSNFSLFVNKNISPSRQKIIFQTISKAKQYTKGVFTISNTYCSDNSPYITAKNNINVKYEKKGTILSVKNFDLIKDFSFTANSSQNYTTSTSKENHYDSAKINTNAEVAVTIAKINFNADAATSFYKNTFTQNESLTTETSSANEILTYAGHIIKTESPLFGIFSVNENYRYNIGDKTVKKSDSAEINLSKFNIPLNMKADSSAITYSYYQTQENNFNFTFNPNISKTKLNFSAVLTTSQKILSSNFTNSSEENYFSEYKKNSLLQISCGESAAQSRKIDFSAKSSLILPFNNISPSIEYNWNTLNKDSSEQTLTDTQSIKFALPFTVAKNNFSFQATRTGKGSSSTKSKNYKTDFLQTAENFAQRDFFYKSIPFYDLFEKKELSANLSYSTRYDFLWKRNLFNSVRDLYIPSAMNVALTRDIKSLESDVYQLKVIISENAINLFGKNSSKKLFDWYESDEILSNFTGILKIPADSAENIVYQTTFYSQILLYISSESSVQTALNLSFATDKTWNFGTTLIWSRPGKSSPLISLLNLIPFFKNKEIDWNLTRKETLNIETGSSNLIFHQNYLISHSLEINFLEHYTFSAGAGVNFNSVQNNSDTISLNFNLGGKIIFQ